MQSKDTARPIFWNLGNRGGQTGQAAWGLARFVQPGRGRVPAKSMKSPIW